MKKTMLSMISLLTVCSLSACSADSVSALSSTQSVSSVTIQETEEEPEVLEIASSLDLLYDYSDPKVVASFSTDIVLAQIISIDGCSTYNEQRGEYGGAYTYGRLKISEVYKGDLKAGDEVDFLRSGGTVTYDEWYASLFEAEKDKFDAMEGEKPDYVLMKYEDDIMPEEGKTYLVYMNNPESRTFARKNCYAMGGLQYGLREARETDGDIEILNNDTQEWESIQTNLSAIE